MVDFNLLGQCIDTTFGRSSTTEDSTRSVKVKLQGAGDETHAIFIFNTIVNTFGTHDIREAEERCRVEAEVLIKDAVARIKSEYKELGGGSLKFTQCGDVDAMELISSTAQSARRMSYYRRQIVFTME
jgi:hypothetical protein